MSLVCCGFVCCAWLSGYFGKTWVELEKSQTDGTTVLSRSYFLSQYRGGIYVGQRRFWVTDTGKRHLNFGKWDWYLSHRENIDTLPTGPASAVLNSDWRQVKWQLVGTQTFRQRFGFAFDAYEATRDTHDPDYQTSPPTPRVPVTQTLQLRRVYVP